MDSSRHKLQLLTAELKNKEEELGMLARKIESIGRDKAG